MARELIDLRVSIFGGPIASIGDLMLFAHVRGRPSGGAEFLVLCPNGPGGTPTRRGETELDAPDVDRLLDRLGSAGLPGRVPRVVPNESLLADGPLLAIALRARGSALSFDLPLHGAGFSGADASPLREALMQLVELTPIGGRTPVRDAIRRALGERRASRLAPAATAPGITPIGAEASWAFRGWDLPRPTAWEPKS